MSSLGSFYYWYPDVESDLLISVLDSSVFKLVEQVAGRLVTRDQGMQPCEISHTDKGKSQACMCPATGSFNIFTHLTI